MLDVEVMTLQDIEIERLTRLLIEKEEFNQKLFNDLEYHKKVSDAWNGKKKKVIAEIRALQIKLRFANRSIEIQSLFLRQPRKL